MQTNINTKKLLSKWWQSDSCREAFERAANVKRESLKRFLVNLNSKREEEKRAFAVWETIQ